MEILKTSYQNPNPNVIAKASRMIKNSGVVIYPADTAGYSVGANALNVIAIQKVYEVKKRPETKPMNVAVPDIKTAQELVYWNDVAEILARKFLPGPLAIILKKKSYVPNLLTADKDTLGIRIPNSPIAIALAKTSGFPITITTANISGQQVSSYSLEEILSQFRDDPKPDLIIDVGTLPDIPQSTIVDCATTPPKIIREGQISQTEIEKVLGVSVE